MSSLIPFLPQPWFLTFAFLYGLIIGSFLNVVIYRFHTGKSLAGSSHCLSCAKPLRPYELLPLISYLVLRGRCRGCGSHITLRYFFVEALTGLLFLLAALTSGSLVELAYLAVVLSLLMVIVVYDIQHFIIPDSLTIAVTVVTLGYFGWQWWSGIALPSLGMDVGAALIGSGFFYMLWFVSKGRWLGFGDVKLAFPLGLVVGAPLVFTMIVYSFWIGAVISLVLVGLSKLERGQVRFRSSLGNLTIKSVVPFAPFLIAGCLLTYFTQLDVLTLITLVSF